jgi:hypothetical protein
VIGDLGGAGGDLAVGEAQDDPATRLEFGVVGPVVFELLSILAVVAPPVALDHDGRTNNYEVDLPASDVGVKLDGRQPIPAGELPESRFEDGVGRFGVE